jgi:hypothetical protein
MTSAQATAEVFWSAFLAMKPRERKAFLERLLANRSLRQDLLDAALIEDRKGEPGRPLEDVVASGRTRTRGTSSR